MNRQLTDIRLKGHIQAPPSKSDAQRAILIAAITSGTSTIINPGRSEDVQSMISNIQVLGTEVNASADQLVISGSSNPNSNQLHFNANESGLTFRMLAALCTALEGTQEINGTGSLLNRTQQFIIDDMTNMGCAISSNNGFPPISIQGKCNMSEIDIHGSESSQFLSGLLISLPLNDKLIKINVDDLKSTPYTHMTLSTMAHFGVTIENHQDRSFKKGDQSQYIPCTYTVEGDWSGASCWFVGAALGADIQIQGLNPDSLQADRAILSALSAANCEVQFLDGTYSVNGYDRKAFDFDATNCPDLFPALVTLAAGCEGQSTIHGTSRLYNKESDRATVLREEFSKLGLSIAVEGDQMVINGIGKLNGGVIDPHNDHRIAMSAAIASLLCSETISVLDTECVGKSYPEFWSDFDALK